jgi:hypothetical protein
MKTKPEKTGPNGIRYTDTPCDCGRGTVAFLRDGTRTCTDALSRFKLIYNRLPYAGVAS